MSLLPFYVTFDKKIKLAYLFNLQATSITNIGYNFRNVKALLDMISSIQVWLIPEYQIFKKKSKN